MSAQAHYSQTFEANDEDWWEPVCSCGQKLGVYPTAEDAADALAQHAYERGFIDGWAAVGGENTPQ